MSTAASSSGLGNKKWFVLIAVILGLCWFLGINPLGVRKIAQKNLPPELRAPGTTQPQPQVQPPPPQSAPPQSANLEDFRVLPDSNADEQKFQLDASVLRQELPATVSYGDKVESWLDGKICDSGVVYPCTGPDGQGRRPVETSESSPDWAKYNLGTFQVKEAFPQAAVGYVGGAKFQIGRHKQEWPIPAGTVNEHLVVGYNLHEGEQSNARGGGVLTIKITRGIE